MEGRIEAPMPAARVGRLTEEIVRYVKIFGARFGDRPA
jgi:hypothetical protein